MREKVGTCLGYVTVRGRSWGQTSGGANVVRLSYGLVVNVVRAITVPVARHVPRPAESITVTSAPTANKTIHRDDFMSTPPPPPTTGCRNWGDYVASASAPWLLVRSKMSIFLQFLATIWSASATATQNPKSLRGRQNHDFHISANRSVSYCNDHTLRHSATLHCYLLTNC